jgi:hypothetical protein
MQETRLTLGEPTIIAIAPPEEDRWGYYQFPRITQLADQSLLVTFQVADDSAHSYGKDGTLSFLSPDEGRSWEPTDAKERCCWHGAVETSNGEQLSLRTALASKLEELELPEPESWVAASYDGVGGVTQRYRFEELPKELQRIPLNILKGNQWNQGWATISNPEGYWIASEGLLPVIFFGQVRRLPDATLLAGVYPYYHDSFCGNKSGIAFYRSENEGNSWQLHGHIPYEPDLDYDDKAELRQGFTELSWVVLADKSLYCVLRTTDASPGPAPLYATRSQDGGATWSKPEVIAPSGVEPKLLLLENGTLVLSAGRPAVQLRVSLDGRGEKWDLIREVVPHRRVDPRGDSCGYTDMIALGADRILIVYSLFRHEIAPGVFTKAIAVREVSFDQVEEPCRTEIGEPEEIKVVPYADGSPFREIPLAKGQAHGALKTYYRDGILAAEVPYWRGERHGEQRQYERDGSLSRTVNWVRGQVEGAVRHHDCRGNLLKERFISSGRQ